MDAGLIYGCITPHPPILVPEVAGHRLEQVSRTRDAMQRVAAEIRHLEPDTLVLVSPHAPLNPHSMTVVAADRYLGGFEAFGAPSVRFTFRGDAALALALEAECRLQDVPHGRLGKAGGTHRLDHGAAVPLYFLDEAGVKARLVLLSFSALEVGSHHRFGRAIAAAARSTGRRVVLVASGDLSHRLAPGAPAGFSPAGREFDEALVTALARDDHRAVLEMDEGLLYEAGECGYRSVVIALGALPEARTEVLSYEGPFGVGYMVARILPGEPLRTEGGGRAEQVETRASELTSEEAEALWLARRAVECHVRGDAVPEPPGRPSGLLAQEAGVFVSLKLGGQLRGCIGTFQPMEPNVAAEIQQNAVAAATRDPRFLPVAREELPHLRYSIDILSEPEPVADPTQLDPRRYGVIVQAGGRRGLLLPDLEGVDTVEEQVGIARRKAGIPPGAPVVLYRFAVRRIREQMGSEGKL